MASANNPMNDTDPFDLQRFVSAQNPIYEAVLNELRNGRKRTHWMWFIFPQVAGLGFSPISQRYAIKSSHEARHYLAHPILGLRLIECAETVLAIEGRSVSEIFGSPDDMKLKSSMTLFAALADQDSVFAQILDKFFDGKRDIRTLSFLSQPGQNDTIA